MKSKMWLKDLTDFSFTKEMMKGISDRIDELYPNPEQIEVKRVVIPRQKAEIDDEKREITMNVSTRDVDRDQEVVMPKGIDVTEFKLSPVILEGHDYSKPQIGKAVKIVKTSEAMRMTIQFAPTPEGDKYLALAKFMPLSASIGFIPLDVLRPSDRGFGDEIAKMVKEWPEFKRNTEVTAIIRKSRLLETSIVPVPANPHAIQLEVSKAIEEGKIEEKDAKVVLKAFNCGEKHEHQDTGPDPVNFRLLMESGKYSEKEAREWLKELDEKSKKAEHPKPKARILPQAKAVEPVRARMVNVKSTIDTEEITKIVKNGIALASGKI